ncbi:RNA polymerase sigma factor [Pedobacter sp. MW01-1-1]|uniref:RNA polymerase sigma factor n=1 Tax=Pedobacter sp. MW01-1-1 TaxID=3383027 RepID=UPI003FF0BC21
MQKDLADEKILLAKIAAGNQQAFATLFNFYKNRVLGYAFAILQEEELAEEIVQEVFIKIWLGRKTLGEIANFGAFLRISTRNLTLNALKKIALEHKKYQEVKREHSDADLSTENAIQYREIQRLVDVAIEKLSPQQKIVYKMCKIDNLKQKDVAEKLGISLHTVKAHLRDAVKIIKTNVDWSGEINAIAFFLFFLK